MVLPQLEETRGGRTWYFGTASAEGWAPGLGSKDTDLLLVPGTHLPGLQQTPAPVSFSATDSPLWAGALPGAGRQGRSSPCGWALPCWRGTNKETSQLGKTTAQVPLPWRPARGVTQTLVSPWARPRKGQEPGQCWAVRGENLKGGLFGGGCQDRELCKSPDGGEGSAWPQGPGSAH